MCGIVGYVGHQNATQIIVEGLRKLEYRGYDSAGVAVVSSDHKTHIHRAAGKLRNLDTLLKERPTQWDNLVLAILDGQHMGGPQKKTRILIRSMALPLFTTEYLRTISSSADA